MRKLRRLGSCYASYKDRVGGGQLLVKEREIALVKRL